MSASGCPEILPAGYQSRTGDDGKRVCVEIYGNRLEGNAGGIVGIQQKRGTGVYGSWRISGLYVHDNFVEWSRGFVGLLRDDGIDTVWSANNRFDRNSYQASTTSKRFHWSGERTWTNWQSVPQDATGVISS